MTKTTEENLSQSKYAEHRNVTKSYIARLVKEGRLHLIKGKFNVEMSDAELDNKSKDDKASNYWSEKVLLREYTPSMHKSLKFKLQLSYPANEIEIRLLLKYDKGDKIYLDCELPNKTGAHKHMVSCNRSLHGTKMNFDMSTGKYAFSNHFGYVGGDGDTLAIAYGKCDKF